MNRSPDVELVLREYLADDGLTAPDYILDVVEGRISRQPQRRAWRLLWRLQPMSNTLKLAAGLAAVIVVAVVAWQLLPGRDGGIGSLATPTPAVQPSPTAAAYAVVDLPEGRLPGGRYRFHPFDAMPNFAAVADVPSGWHGGPPWAVVGPTTEEPPGGILLGFLGTDGLFSDPCQWDVDGTGSGLQPGDVEVGPDVADLVEALRANTSYTASTPKPVAFGPYEGQELEIQLPADLDLATCDKESDGRSRYFVFAGEQAGLYAQGSGTDRDRWRLFIVDVAGTRVIVANLYYPETPVADQEAAQAIIESIEFTQ